MDDLSFEIGQCEFSMIMPLDSVRHIGKLKFRRLSDQQLFPIAEDHIGNIGIIAGERRRRHAAELRGVVSHQPHGGKTGVDCGTVGSVFILFVPFWQNTEIRTQFQHEIAEATQSRRTFGVDPVIPAIAVLMSLRPVESQIFVLKLRFAENLVKQRDHDFFTVFGLHSAVPDHRIVGNIKPFRFTQNAADMFSNGKQTFCIGGLSRFRHQIGRQKKQIRHQNKFVAVFFEELGSEIPDKIQIADDRVTGHHYFPFNTESIFASKGDSGMFDGVDLVTWSVIYEFGKNR